jgi:hypothetical protein
MTRRLGLAVGLALGLAAGARPDDVAPPPPVEGLIEQLGHRDFRLRDAAAKALAARGPDALPALRQALGHPDPEVRQRLTQLVADAERAALLAPKRVTLACHQTPVREALAELTRQTGYRIDAQTSGPQPLVTLEAAGLPFWEALDKVSAQAGLILQSHQGNQGGLVLYAQNAYVPFADYRGPFRLTASSFHYSKSLTLATLTRSQLLGGQRSEQLSFMFSVVAEPKLPLLGVGQPRLTAAVDDQGHSLVPPPVRAQPYEVFHGGYYGHRNLILQAQVQLSGPDPAARSVKVLRGALPVTILAEQKPEIVVEKVLEVKDRKFEGNQVTLEIEGVKDGPGKTYQVAMTARRGTTGATAHDYAWTNSLHQRVELTDEKGNKFLAHGFNWTNGTPTSVQGTFMFGDPGTGQLGKPYKLTYYDWVTLQHQVEFEFRDLPLP